MHPALRQKALLYIVLPPLLIMEKVIQGRTTGDILTSVSKDICSGFKNH